jgi:hypothetical protein
LKTTTFAKVAAGATAALTVALLYSAHGTASAKTGKVTSMASVSQGKMLVSQYRCNGCHGANLAGRPRFSPSLHANASLKHYTSATFTRLLLTGVTDDGGHVRPPMPVYGAGMMHMGHGPGGPPPGGMHHGGMHPSGMRPGGMHMPPPMKAGQAASIYAYLHTLK